jgi:hypothetical protein
MTKFYKKTIPCLTLELGSVISLGPKNRSEREIVLVFNRHVLDSTQETVIADDLQTGNRVFSGSQQFSVVHGWDGSSSMPGRIKLTISPHYVSTSGFTLRSAWSQQEERKVKCLSDNHLREAACHDFLRKALVDSDFQL